MVVVVVVVVVMFVAGCGSASWKPRDVRELGGQRADYLVVTDRDAFELRDAVVRGDTLSGTVVHAWALAAPISSRSKLPNLSPETIAERLGWEPFEHPATVAIPAQRIVTISRHEEESGTGTVLGFGLGLMLVVGALVVAGATWQPSCGRPLRVRGRRCVTPLATTDEWIADVEVAPVPAPVLPILRTVWTQEAQAEHAAIAAFAKLSLELIALGAPPDLVIRAHRAALQEVQHARLCFGVASAYAGTTLGPAPLPEALAGDTVDLDRVAREALLDGCLREGLAAEIAATGASTAIDPAIARVMRIQAREEAQHAELCRAIVKWAIGRGGEPMRDMLLGQVSRAAFPRCDDLPEYGRVPHAVVAAMHAALLERTRQRIRMSGLPTVRLAA